MVWGSGKSTRYGGGGGFRSLFPLFKDQVKQNLVMCKYTTNSVQKHDKIDDVITGTL